MNAVVGVILVLCFGFLVLLIARELWCWYWKINLALAKADEALEVLRTIARDLASFAQWTVEQRNARQRQAASLNVPPPLDAGSRALAAIEKGRKK